MMVAGLVARWLLWFVWLEGKQIFGGFGWTKITRKWHEMNTFSSLEVFVQSLLNISRGSTRKHEKPFSYSQPSCYQLHAINKLHGAIHVVMHRMQLMQLMTRVMQVMQMMT